MISFVNLDIARRCKTVCDVAGRSETVTEAHIFSWGSRFGWVAMARRPIWQTVRCAWSRIGQQQRRPFCALAWDRRSGLSCNWGVTGFRRAGKTWVRTRAAAWRLDGGPAPRLGASHSRVDLASPAAPALPDRHGASFRMRIHRLANGRGNRSPATIVAPDGDRWRWRSRPRAAGSVRVRHRSARLARAIIERRQVMATAGPPIPGAITGRRGSSPDAARAKPVQSRRRMARGFWRCFSLPWRSVSRDCAAKANSPAKPVRIRLSTGSIKVCSSRTIAEPGKSGSIMQA